MVVGTWSVCSALYTATGYLRDCTLARAAELALAWRTRGTLMQRLKKRVVMITVSEKSLRKSLMPSMRSMSASTSVLVLTLGSHGHCSILWPISLQQLQRMFLSCFYASSLLSGSLPSSSSSSLLSCLLNLQPGASLLTLPQHHHMSSPRSL